MNRLYSEWMELAACKNESPALFDLLDTTNASKYQLEAAKSICRDCPVRMECFGWALQFESATGHCGTDDAKCSAGIYGGHSWAERRHMMGYDT